MAQSPEYPDLRWVPPKAFGFGRDGKAVRFVVIHYTAGAERSTSAEDGAAYDARRTDGTSTHYFVDQNSIVQCVRTTDRANAARSKGNRLGIQYELCGTVQTRAQWLDAASSATLRLAARQVARDCRKYGIPVRRLTVAETRRAWTEFPNGPRGIVGHVDCTNAYPEDGGDHTDPGPQFPWDLFLDLVQAELEPEDDMSWTDDVITNPAWRADAKTNPTVQAKFALYDAWNRVHNVEVALAALAVQIKALTGADLVDEQQIISGVLAGLPVSTIVEGIVSALPPELAGQVSDEIAQRLAS
jgi:N-acetyl-anhydromuramyl-L-alanine amidase AmpD